MSRLLEVVDLKAFYGPIQALDGISFGLARGEVTALLGANGAGKSTTLRALSGMIRASGTVTFDGQRIDGLPVPAIARCGIAHVPEGRGTFERFSVEDNLRLGAISRPNDRGIVEDIERCFRYFPILEQRRRQQAGTLSGGEQQMLAVARALMLRPRLMLLDEPSFGLAPLIVQELFGILGTINRNEGVAMLIVEQNAALALSLASTAHVLETGSIRLSGTAAEIRGNDAVRRSYLGGA